MCWTLRDSLSGLSGSVRVHRDRGSSHNSSYNVQAVVSRQSSQRQLLLLHALVLGLVVDTHSRYRGRGEQRLSSWLSSSSRHSQFRGQSFPVVHEQRLSACASVIYGTCPDRRSGG
jgi:hypothetical protein